MNTSVSLTSVFAWICWALALACVAIETFLPSPPVSLIGVLLVGGGATLHVKGFVNCLAQTLRNREEGAFNLGRESVRSLRP